MKEIAYVRETDDAPMVEVAPHQYVNHIWLDDQRLSAEESRRAAIRRAKKEARAALIAAGKDPRTPGERLRGVRIEDVIMENDND